jgi:hypothetical protein
VRKVRHQNITALQNDGLTTCWAAPSGQPIRGLRETDAAITGYRKGHFYHWQLLGVLCDSLRVVRKKADNK